MNWTPTDAIRRWIVVAGLIIGPVLLVLSVAINFAPPSDSMRADFDTMAAHPDLIVLEALLEAAGFLVVLAAFAGSAQALRSRGGALGTWGAVLCVIGIVGFSLSNATGFTLAELAQLPDRDAGFAAAMAMMNSTTAGTVGAIVMVLELAGQIGMLLVILGLIRARLVRIWPLLLTVVGIVVNLVGGIMVTTLIADLLLLAVTVWIAIGLTRCGRGAWLGEPATTPAEPASVAA